MKNICSLLILAVIGIPYGHGAYAGHLTVSGCSVSTVGYLSDLAREYEKRTGVRIFVRGGGSVVGLEDVTGGKVDFAASCRSRQPDDPAEIKFIQVAWDALVFIVHKTNPLNSIAVDDVRAIYAGELTSWKRLNGRDTPIKLYISRPQKGLSGVEASTKHMVLKGKDTVRSKNSLALASTGIVEQMVEKTAEGFATTGFSSAQKRDVKMLRVNGVFPTKVNISNDTYPFRRPLYLITHGSPGPEVKRFIDFALSREGQHIISSQGVIPLSGAR